MRSKRPAASRPLLWATSLASDCGSLMPSSLPAAACATGWRTSRPGPAVQHGCRAPPSGRLAAPESHRRPWRCSSG
ncbi:MAG: hypothetical protein ACK559_05180, partial [bacterium]